VAHGAPITPLHTWKSHEVRVLIWYSFFLVILLLAGAVATACAPKLRWGAIELGDGSACRAEPVEH
jgi:hypothetical protein